MRANCIFFARKFIDVEKYNRDLKDLERFLERVLRGFHIDFIQTLCKPYIEFVWPHVDLIETSSRLHIDFI